MRMVASAATGLIAKCSRRAMNVVLPVVGSSGSGPPDEHGCDPIDGGRSVLLYAQLRPHRIFVARRAPSANASNLAQQIEGWPTRVPIPQSVPASTFSRPTSLA